MIKLLVGLCAAESDAATLRAAKRLDAAAWQQLIDLAQLHKCAPWLFERLRVLDLQAGMPVPAHDRLLTIVQRNAKRNLRRLSDLRELGALLSSASPVIVLKGARLMRSHYADLSLRFMTDTDVMARPEHIDAVSITLQNLGWRRASQRAPGADEQRHDISFLRSDMHLELHRAFLDEGTGFRIDYEGVWRRATRDGTTGLHIMSLEDQLLHVCLHAAYHHSFNVGLYPLIDVSNICNDPTLNIEVLLRRAQQWGAERCLLLVLEVTRCLLAAKMPEAINHACMPIRTHCKGQLSVAKLSVHFGPVPRESDFSALMMLVDRLSTLDGWRALPDTFRRRFTRDKAQRSRWPRTREVGTVAQLRPLVVALAHSIHRPAYWRTALARVRSARLRPWMESRSTV